MKFLPEFYNIAGLYKKTALSYKNMTEPSKLNAYFSFGAGGGPLLHPLHPAQLPEAHPELFPKDLYPLHIIYPAATAPINPTITVSIICASPAY